MTITVICQEDEKCELLLQELLEDPRIFTPLPMQKNQNCLKKN